MTQNNCSYQHDKVPGQVNVLVESKTNIEGLSQSTKELKSCYTLA